MRKIKFVLFPICLLLVGMIACKTEPTQQAETPPPSGSGNPTIDALTAEIQKSPKDASLYAARAEAYYKAEAYDEAIADLKNALVMDSTNVNYHHLLADVYLDYYQSRLALRTMERAAALYPERIPTLLKLAEFQYILKQYTPSLKTVDQILKIDPQEAEAYFMMGRNFREMGDDDRAIASFQKAVDFDPDLLDAWILLGELFAKKNNAVALRFYDNALAIDSTNVAAYFGKARYYHQQGELHKAIYQYKKVSRFMPTFEESYYNMGLAYLEMDSIQTAYKNFDMAIKMNPTFHMAYYYRGVSAEAKGDKAAAKNDYQQALNLKADFTKAQIALDNLK